MEQYYGMTAEMYRAVTALVDDRMKEVLVTRQDYDRLVEAQARTEKRLEELAQAQARTEKRLGELAQAQARTEKRLEELAEAQVHTERRVEELAEAQVHTEERLSRLEATVQQLAEAQVRTERRLEELIGVVANMQNTLAAVKGRQLEITYREKAGAYFGPLLRRLRVLSPVELEDELEAHLSDEEFKDLLRLDLLVSGQPRHRPEAPPVWLAVEISSVVDSHDVERALRRATALQQAGYRAIPAVAGEQATEDAEQEARAHQVVLVRDGWAVFWEEALDKAL